MRSPARSSPVAAAEGGFFPLDRKLGLGAEGYSPAVLRKIEYAGANSQSFVEASRSLGALGDIAVSPKHVQRLTERLGEERRAARDREVEAFRGGKLAPEHREPPSVVAVHVDAGKIQLRADDGAPGVREPGWGDSKVACCVTYAAAVSREDPQPEPPRTFLDPPKVARLCAEMERVRCQKPEPTAPAPQRPSAGAEAAASEHRGRGRPKPLVRTAVATLGDADAFGWLVAAEAQRRGFFQAARRAIVGDGGNWIGPLGSTHFPRWCQVLDFLHLLVHLYAAAQAVWSRDPKRAWQLYVALLRDAWSGRAARVIERLEAERARIRLAHLQPGRSEALKTIDLNLDYLRENSERMHYDHYRRQGLPTTSVLVESLIKQFNQRTKGTEKFWTRSRGEALLQARAAHLSQDDRAARFLRERVPTRAAPSRCFRRVA